MNFLLDECITLPVARALAAVECQVVYAPDVQALRQGATDEAVYNYAANKGMVLLTQDRGLGQDKTKQRIARGSGCGVFVLRRPKHDSMRLKLIRILTIWEELERIRTSMKPPFVYECRSEGMKDTRLL